MKILKPHNFSFKNTIFSHGWSELLPFKIDEKENNISYVFFEEGFQKPITVQISETPNSIKIEFAENDVTKFEKEKIRSKVKHILRIDDDLNEFFKLVKKDKNFVWMADKKVGRLIRSPTVFEDLIKTICTTNCSWGLTKNMVSNFVEKLGESTNGGRKSFPTPNKLAELDENFYREEIRAGYRSPYFVELSETIANGDIDPEKWLTTDLPTNKLKKEMKKIKGVGDYAAENLLKLVGRYDGLALDSFLRSEFYQKHNQGNSCSDKEIHNYYEKFGHYRGLAIWFDLTQRWFT